MPKPAKQPKHEGQPVPRPYPSWAWWRDCTTGEKPPKLPPQMRFCRRCERRNPPIYFSGGVCVDCAARPDGDFDNTRRVGSPKDILKDLIIKGGQDNAERYLRCLTKEQAAAVQLVYIDGLTQNAAASKMKIRPASVSTLLKRARKQLAGTAEA